jgi:hypothetical protein
MKRTRLLPILLVVVLLFDAPTPAAEELSSSGKKLLKHAVAMGKKRKTSEYDEKRFVKLLAAVPRDELPAVGQALRGQPKASDAHRALAERVDGMFWEAVYPGSSALKGFAKAVGSTETAQRRLALSAAFTLEDLTSARKLAIETASWKDPEARMAAAQALGDLIDLQAVGEDGEKALAELVKDPSPAVGTTAVTRLEDALRTDAIDAYLTGLDDFETAKATGPDGAEQAYCFGARAFTRLAALSGRHEGLEVEGFRKLSEGRRAEIALDFNVWWKAARPTFTFRKTHWERFAAAPVVRQKVITRTRPEEFFFQFRSPKDGSRVRLELKHLQFRAVAADSDKRVVDWRVGYGMGGERNAFGTVEGTGVPVNRRHGAPKQGAAWISLTAQIIGEKKARVVVRYADFESKN